MANTIEIKNVENLSLDELKSKLEKIKQEIKAEKEKYEKNKTQKLIDKIAKAEAKLDKLRSKN